MAILNYRLQYTVHPNCSPLTDIRFDFYDSVGGSGTLLGSVNGAPAAAASGQAWVVGGSYQQIQIDSQALFSAAGTNRAYMIVTITDSCSGQKDVEIEVTSDSPTFTTVVNDLWASVNDETYTVIRPNAFRVSETEDAISVGTVPVSGFSTTIAGRQYKKILGSFVDVEIGDMLITDDPGYLIIDTGMVIPHDPSSLVYFTLIVDLYATFNHQGRILLQCSNFSSFGVQAALGNWYGNVPVISTFFDTTAKICIQTTAIRGRLKVQLHTANKTALSNETIRNFGLSFTTIQPNNLSSVPCNTSLDNLYVYGTPFSYQSNFTVISDERTKKNIRTLKTRRLIQRIELLGEPTQARFNGKFGTPKNETFIGHTAQQILNAWGQDAIDMGIVIEQPVLVDSLETFNEYQGDDPENEAVEAVLYNVNFELYDRLMVFYAAYRTEQYEKQTQRVVAKLNATLQEETFNPKKAVRQLTRFLEKSISDKSDDELDQEE